MLGMYLASELPEHEDTQNPARCFSCVASGRLAEFWPLLHRRLLSSHCEDWVGLALARPLRGYNEAECLPGSHAHFPWGRSMKKVPRVDTDSSEILQLLGAAAVPVAFAPGTVSD